MPGPMRHAIALAGLLLLLPLLLAACGDGDAGLTRAEVQKIVREEMAAQSQADSNPGTVPADVSSIVNDAIKEMPQPEPGLTRTEVEEIVRAAIAAVPEPRPGNPLADTEWRLIELGKADSPAAVVGDNPTAEFSTTADMTGWTGCNSYGARYSVRQSELRLDDLSWTEAGCPSQALFRQEQRMRDSLATMERFDVSGEQLTLHSEGGQVLVFERVGR